MISSTQCFVPRLKQILCFLILFEKNYTRGTSFRGFLQGLLFDAGDGSGGFHNLKQFSKSLTTILNYTFQLPDLLWYGVLD